MKIEEVNILARVGIIKQYYRQPKLRPSGLLFKNLDPKKKLLNMNSRLR